MEPEQGATRETGCQAPESTVMATVGPISGYTAREVEERLDDALPELFSLCKVAIGVDVKQIPPPADAERLRPRISGFFSCCNGHAVMAVDPIDGHTIDLSGAICPACLLLTRRFQEQLIYALYPNVGRMMLTAGIK